MLQNEEMKQKITVLTNSTQLAELDSKANRYITEREEKEKDKLFHLFSIQ